MQPNQPAPSLELHRLAVMQASDLAAVYDGDAATAARAGLRHAQQHGRHEEIELWRAVCAIFEGNRRVEL